ncbi:hypothetical protein [Brevundimonas lenta]|uniref:Uncharacterized protein n=1 Tax=Brevundimonas lenta TaxID=424796 RepID=A0A7W6JF20_9CAUL|nr:hypothetical protein [Brevundimonas lenta]MBB4083932.1 hypothetical protein [Brevundimonas lenta]
MVSSDAWTAVAAWVACIFTATVAGPDLIDRMQGSRIDVTHPRQFLAYRDGEGENSIMLIAFDPTILNQSRFPDTTTSILLRIGGPQAGREAAFRAESVIQPIFWTADDEAVECPPMTRCIKKRQMTIGEERADVVNVSAGTARSLYISFPLTADNCQGPDEVCTRFRDFDGAVEVLAANPAIAFTIDLTMADDGLKSVSCVLSAEAKRGWSQLLDRVGEKGWAIGNCA